MKKKTLLLCSALSFLSVSSLTGCARGSGGTIIVWVGSESVSFYRQKASVFKSMHQDFGYDISIIGADTGGAAGQMVSDNTACGDIVTIAHDNIGKLSQAAYICPIIDEELIQQIKDDNPSSFVDVVQNYLGGEDPETGKAKTTFTDEDRYFFGVPYISQALFLYYDTRYVTEEQAQSFEGLVEAARQYDKKYGKTGTKAFTVTGTDGYNNSFGLLARNLSDGNVSSLRLFTNGERYDSYGQDNDEIAIMKWLQRNYADPNGAKYESDSPWSVNIQNHVALSVIGGAWHYNAFKKAVEKEENMGCTILPTFTLTEEDVAEINDVNYPMDNGYTNPRTGKVFKGLPEELQGSEDKAPEAGTTFRGGSFVDCKCFVINYAKFGGPEKYAKMCQLIKYFSSKEVQNESFVKCLNVPAYAGADAFIETTKGKVSDSAYLMGKAQTGMSIYGIPQPITDGTTNTYYYSKNAPDYYLQCIKKSNSGYHVENSNEGDGIRAVLYRMEYTWKHGGVPAKAPETYPADSSIPR